MKKQALSNEMNMSVTARLIAKGTNQPLHGAGYKVRLFDRDFLQDEYLGESIPDDKGNVSFQFAPTAINKTALDDAMPDFFFVLYKYGEVIFQSKVMENVNVEAIEQYQHGVGEVIDLGTFLVEG